VNKEFVLEKDDRRIVTVLQKPSGWRGRFVFEHGSNRYELKKESTWGNTFVLSRDGIGLLGSVTREGFFKREWIVDLPEEVPLEVRVSIVWLVIILWKQAESAAAAAGGAAGARG
jgi:hypothetical protein